MRIDIITIFPEYFRSPFSQSIIKIAQKKKLLEIYIHDLRTYSENNQRSVDDYPFGGESGMVMNIQPIDNCIKHLKSQRDYDEIIYLTPDSYPMKQETCNKLSTLKNLILLCGHYKGVDQRVREHLITMEISIGDYVLTGGELPAIILTDAIARIIPGVISNETSALSDSFQDNLLSSPIYTRPSEYNGWKVPKILLSGNKKKIEEWKEKKAIERTKKIRPDLMK